MTAVGVCGLGRCGSTMLMAVLDAGGVPVVGDPPSYELEDPEQLAELELDGQAVKLLDLSMSIQLPTTGEWLLLWLDRNPVEQARSTVKFMRACGLALGPDAQREIRRSNEERRPAVLEQLEETGTVEKFTYRRFVWDREVEVVRLADTLAARAPDLPELDIEAAASVIHERDARCRDGLWEHEAIEAHREVLHERARSVV